MTDDGTFSTATGALHAEVNTSKPDSMTRKTTSKITKLEYGTAAVLAIVARIAFWLITRREFEDALITAAHAQNAADGLGLIHHAGDGVVHGFTSAISVLVPLIGEVLVDGAGLSLIRLVSVVAGAGSVIVALMLSENLGLTRPVRWIAVAFLAFNGNHLLYGMAGMETQIAVCVLLVSALFVVREKSPLLVGTSVGLALLARPDFLIWGACVIGVALFRNRGSALRVTMWAGLVVAPWLVFTTIYYGSPIPNTITAKSQTWGGLRDLVSDGVGEAVRYAGSTAQRLLYSFAPFFDNSQSLESPIPEWLALFASITVLALAVRGALALASERQWWPVLLFFVLYGAYRVAALPDKYFDWYVPPFTAVAVLLAAKGLEETILVERAKSIVAVSLIVLFTLPLPWTIGLERTVALEIDGEIRRPLAEYLDAVASGESVVAESAGFIGYYSDVVLWDFPGLTSAESRTALERTDTPTLQYLINAVRPQWIVVRPYELRLLERDFPDAAAEYATDRRFERDRIQGAVEFQGYEVESIDETFLVMKRRS